MSATGNPYTDTHVIDDTLRREFGLLPGLVRSVSAKDEERVRIVADHVTLLCGFLHHHHSLISEVQRRLGTWCVSGDNEDGEVLADTLQRLAAALYEHTGPEGEQCP